MKETTLKRIFKDAVRQGPKHQSNIERIFKLLREAVEKEFIEDNGPTLDHFMLELFEKSQSWYARGFRSLPTVPDPVEPAGIESAPIHKPCPRYFRP